MKIKYITTLLLISFGIFTSAFGQSDTINNSNLSRNAPQDTPVAVFEKDSEEYEKIKAEYIKKALETLPEAKERFVNGLKTGEVFYLKISLHDNAGRSESVFIRVKKWENEKIVGLIENVIQIVDGYHFYQTIEFEEKDIEDWLISKPDGSEDGNYFGKYLDTLTKK